MCSVKYCGQLRSVPSSPRPLFATRIYSKQSTIFFFFLKTVFSCKIQAPVFTAIEQNKKGCELRFEGRKFLVRFEGSLMLLMGVLEGILPFETVKSSSAETGRHLKLALPHAPVPPVPH